MAGLGNVVLDPCGFIWGCHKTQGIIGLL